MSEVQSRPAPRGRSSARGGRGGPRGGARGGRHINGDHKQASDIDALADQGEIGEMKKQYSSEVATLKEMFPDWTDVDLVFALEETQGDLPSTIERITEGNVSQFAEVPKKTKDRARSKVKDTSAGGTDASMTSRPSRSRGGIDAARGGGRGRGDRGRGGFRGGARGGAPGVANGVRATTPKSVPTTESPAWDAIPSANKENESVDTNAGEGAPGGQWGSVIASEVTPNTASEGVKSSLIPDGGPKKTWASMFAKPKPAPAPAPKPEADAPPIEEPELAALTPDMLEPTPPVGIENEGMPEIAPVEPPIDDMTPAITPSKDELTEDNVEHLPDASNRPPPTETAASQVGSTRDIGSATPSVAHQSIAQQPIGRPGLGGFATSALKATNPSGRSASFQRRILEQQEAVVMPDSSHSVDKATVQFGMMGLNGDAVDVDEDREEAETRPQPPQQSPPSQPRASLPPAPRQPPPPESAPEVMPTPKQTHGLPPAPQQPLSQQQQSPNPIGAQLGAQPTQAYNQFGRFGHQPETGAPPQKQYDPFGQQAAQSPLDAYNSVQGQQQAGQSHLGGQSSAQNDYSSYPTSDYQRNAYQTYYNNYGQQHSATQQDAGTTQQRAGSGFGSAPGDSGYGSQAQQSAVPSRYGESQNSGHNTPNPALGGASQHQSQPGQHMHQQHHQQGQHAAGGGYPYGHPYYNSPYYQAYMNQYNAYGGQGFGQQPYGGSKGSMYGQPHHGYGISPQQSSYDQHSSSPANAPGFGQSSLHGQESNSRGAAPGFGDYGRSGSAQPSQGAPAAGSGFGGMGDVFGRQSGFPSGNQSYSQQQVGQQSGPEDSLKPFGDSKPTSGPSPTSLGQPGRPGSATNNSSGQGQSGLPPPQSHQQGFGGYPSHLAQGSQYGGLGGLGHQGGQSHQQGFGGYGGGYGGNYGSYGRGGWGTNYGNH